MLRIRKEQMEWFAEKTRAGYLKQLIDYLVDVHAPRFGETPGGLRRAVESFATAAIAKADALGFTIQYDATQLVLVLLLLGLDAEEKHPFVHEILTDRGLVPRGKVRRLVAELGERGFDGTAEIDLGEPMEAV